MEESKYLITEDQLNCIANWAREHPTQRFSTESMDDGNPFLSCTFFPYETCENDEPDMEDSGYWELDEYIKEDRI